MVRTAATRLLGALLILLPFSLGFAANPVRSSSFPMISTILQDDRDLKEFTQVRELFRIQNPGSRPYRQSAAQVKRAGILNDRLDTIYVPTEVLDQDWNSIEGNWMNVMMLSMAYDARGREIERTAKAWFGVEWMYQFNHLRSYDANGRLVRILSRIWTGSVWQNNARDTIIYDGAGNPVEEVVEIFNGSVWSPFQRYLVTYSGSLGPAEIVGQNWAGGAWVNSFRYAWTYDGSGRNTEFLTQSWIGGAWTNNLRSTYTYDGSDNRTGELDQFWTGAAWNNDTRYAWAFDGSDYVVEEIEERWIGSAWENYGREGYTNDPDGILVELIRQYWDGFGWMDDKITYFTYDGSTMVEALTMLWDVSTWVNFHVTSNSWLQMITSAEITQNYPVADKWNMVSVPLDVLDYSRTTVFPTAVSNAFAFDAGYVSSPTLENGRGYWLKFDGAQSVPVTGLLMIVDTIDVKAGWNMVGSIGVPVTASTVTSIPGGLVSSSFYSFDNGYAVAPTIVPGKGYWVKVSEAGKLVLSGSGNTPVAARLRMELDDELPPAPPAETAGAVAPPSGFRLAQNYPNPFNPVTTIAYAVPSAGPVRLVVFNALGQEVAVLVDGVGAAGERTATFDATGLPSGIYAVRLTAGTDTEVRKMLLLR